jgi:hypothetical protein
LMLVSSFVNEVPNRFFFKKKSYSSERGYA